MSNHLGNVLEVLTDRKLQVQLPDSEPGLEPLDGGIVDYYIADVVSQSDYFPFGMTYSNTDFYVDPVTGLDVAIISDNDYRYSFQGQEKDNEIKGDDNSVNFTFRMYDPRTGRFFTTDPLESEFAYNSPYAFSENKIIHLVELEGLETGAVRYGVSPTQPYQGNRAVIRYANYQKIRAQGSNNVSTYNRSTNNNGQYHRNGQVPNPGAPLGRVTNQNVPTPKNNPGQRIGKESSEIALEREREADINNANGLVQGFKLYTDFAKELYSDKFTGGFTIKLEDKYVNNKLISSIKYVVFDNVEDQLLYQEDWVKFNQEVSDFDAQFRAAIPFPSQTNTDGSTNSNYGQEVLLWDAAYKASYAEQGFVTPFEKLLNESKANSDGSVEKKTWSKDLDQIY